MGHPLRWYLPGVIYEVTSRTVQERLLLLPTHEAREIVNGILARALVLFPYVFVHAYVYLSNHFHLLASTRNGSQLAEFLRYVNSNVARELGRLHRWRGPFWARRPRVIPIVDDDAVIERLRYLLSNGVKEGLVASPRDWPGASSTPGLLGDMVVEGVRIRRDRAVVVDGRREVPLEPVVVPLTPIPAWAHLSAAALRERHRELVESIESTAAPTPLGVDAVQRANPHDRPDEPAHRLAPECHASTRALRLGFKRAYRLFVDAFRRASQYVRSQPMVAQTLYPPGSFPSPSGYVTPTSTGIPWDTPCTALASAAVIGLIS